MSQILYRFMMVAIDTIPTAIILIPVLLIARHTLFYPISIGREILLIVFGFYLSAVFVVVGIPSITNIRIDLTFNLIPIIDIVNDPPAYIVNTLLNILLFIPFGFLVPAIWKERRSLKKVALMGFGLSLIIETLQIFTFRLTDIDDLIFNTLGAVLGYYIWLIFLHFVPKKAEAELTAQETTEENKLELPIVFITVFIIIFLVRPFVSAALWDFILK
ncbi:MAG: VanZ family protein [Clostridiales bacterium]|nr:VanZ family protein [Clostridiales bacterium]